MLTLNSFQITIINVLQANMNNIVLWKITDPPPTKEKLSENEKSGIVFLQGPTALPLLSFWAG